MHYKCNNHCNRNLFDSLLFITSNYIINPKSEQGKEKTVSHITTWKTVFSLVIPPKKRYFDGKIVIYCPCTVVLQTTDTTVALSVSAHFSLLHHSNSIFFFISLYQSKMPKCVLDGSYFFWRTSMVLIFSLVNSIGSLVHI